MYIAFGNSPVLIVGAGPTGLVLALSLARRGVRFRIVDAEDGPGEQSRAMGVHARTLEFYRQFGFAEEVVKSGIVTDRVHLRGHGGGGRAKDATTFRLSDMGKGISPYPFLLTYPQDDHERFLVGQLETLGVQVEWRTTLTHFEEVASGVQVTVEKDGTAEQFLAHWLVGCDGARSIVRRMLKIDFAGGTYEQLFYVADTRIDGVFDQDVHANLAAHSFALMMPVRSSGMHRLIGLVPEILKGKEHVEFEDVRHDVEALIGVRVMEVNWFSTYRVHHRVAERLRVGRAFIAGDAGHIHSPAGGQGMNTGIGDAINLGWKLADVVRGRVSPAILDSYEIERLPFAKHLVATTDRAFDGIIASGLKGEFIRRWLAPTAINIATHFRPTRRLAFRTLSQTALSYPESFLSEGQAGIHGGERLPWVEGRNIEDDNFAPLRSLDWQVHVYGESEKDVAVACGRAGLALHVRPWSEMAHDAGLKQNATYLIRPDGYVALATAVDSCRKMESYLKRIGLRLGDNEIYVEEVE